MLVAHDDDVMFLLVVIQRLGDVEFAGCVAILAVADEGAVHPDVDGGCEAIEAHSHAAVCLQCLCYSLVKSEGTAVDGDAAVAGCSWGLRVLVPIPWHLDVDVGRRPEPLSLERGGYEDGMNIALIKCVGGGVEGDGHP